MPLKLAPQVHFWWPTRILQRRYAGAAGVAAQLQSVSSEPPLAVSGEEAPQGLGEFVRWLEQAARDMAAASLTRDAPMPVLRLSINKLTVNRAGQAPRRAPAALYAGIYCIDPGTIDANLPENGCLTFLDPRPGAEMIPGSSTFGKMDRSVRMPAGKLILFPGWLQQGYSAPCAPDAPSWLAVRFRPVIKF